MKYIELNFGNTIDLKCRLEINKRSMDGTSMSISFDTASFTGCWVQERRVGDISIPISVGNARQSVDRFLRRLFASTCLYRCSSTLLEFLLLLLHPFLPTSPCWFHCLTTKPRNKEGLAEFFCAWARERSRRCPREVRQAQSHRPAEYSRAPSFERIEVDAEDFLN